MENEAKQDHVDTTEAHQASGVSPVDLGTKLLADFTTFDTARRNKEAWALDEDTYGKKTSMFCDTYTPDAPLILVVHASVGSGHRSAAIGVAQALEKLRESQEPAFADGSAMDPNTQIAVIDILAWGEHVFDGNKSASMFTGITRPYYDITWRYTFTGRVLWGGGTFLNYLLWRKWTRFIGHVKPMAVVATHIMGANMSAGARAICGLDFPLICVPTDYETEGLWPHKEADVFCVGTEAMAETLRARKIPESHIRITGIPTRQDFLEEHDTQAVREKLGLAQDCKMILALAGAHLPQPYVNMRKLIAKALPSLTSYPNMHLVLVCGKDAEYQAEVEALVEDYHISNITVMGYTTEVAALMAAADVIVCKAGGLTVTECLCAGTPMILLGRAYGQEKINVAMLTSYGAATHVTTSRELVNVVASLDSTPERLQTLTVNANLLRRPKAADDIAKLTLELAKHTESTKKGAEAEAHDAAENTGNADSASIDESTETNDAAENTDDTDTVGIDESDDANGATGSEDEVESDIIADNTNIVVETNTVPSEVADAYNTPATPRMNRKWFFRIYTGHKPAHIR